MLNGLFNPSRKNISFRKKQTSHQPRLRSRNSILIIEDDPELINLYQKLRKANKWPITVARNSQDALGFLNRKPYDAIVLDWNLPDLNGDALIKVSDQLYNHYTTKHDYKIFVKTPVITCTCESAVDTNIAHSKYFYRQSHWQKPMTYDQIKEKITQLLYDPLETHVVDSNY